MSKKAPHVQLSSADREELSSWLRSTSVTHGLVLRAQIVLKLDAGNRPVDIVRSLGVSEKTVYKWRNRFNDEGIDGLQDAVRSGRPTVIDEKTVQTVLKMTCEQVPHEATHWSIALMAEYAQISTWQVRQIWDAADLKPHRLRTFKISSDPQFAEKVIDVVGLYMDPPNNAMVLLVDEKTQIQALDRTQPGLPLSENRIASRTHDYKRNGTASLYAAFNILSGEVIAKVTDRHRAKEFIEFLKQIDKSTPEDLDLHIILDNLSAHKTTEVKLWLEKHPRVHFHFTPTSASWLNAVEGWFSQLERRALYRGVFTSVKDLEDEIKRYVKVHNKYSAKPFRWTKTAEKIIASVNRAKKSLPN
ncbi:MAG: IS630 family transposase [Gammaproteobacteria bacterium (ex Lamellibrachia satsuma)]|nr:MAG: IS630 family transposase [Gammaproteobacteria bacterium (ex Lamellibrachia satsuma)]